MHIKDFDPYDFSKKEINGVPVYWKNLPWAPCVHIRIVFNVGAFNDPVGKEGLAHFLEHMIFDGCPTMPDKKTIQEFGRQSTIDSLNAYTGEYRTGYTAQCLPENLEKVLLGMHDMIFNSYLRPEDIEHERLVITQEAWGRYKNEKFLAYIKESLKNIFHGTKKERISRPLGWPDTIQAITQQDLSDFHKEKYVKENIFIILAGCIEENDFEYINNFIKKIPSGKKITFIPEKIPNPLELRFIKTADEIGETAEQLHFSIERTSEPLLESERFTSAHTSQLLRDLLEERLRIENSLCYNVSVQWHNGKNHQNVSIDVKTSEDKKDLVEKEIWKIIEDIKAKKFQERFNAIHKIRTEWFKSKEHLSEDIVDYIAEEILREEKIVNYKEFLSEVEKVTYQDVVELVKKTFDPEYVFTEIILPSKK